MTVREAARTLTAGIPEDVTWAVTASANLALRGYDVTPGDVDLKTDADGADTIADTFSDAVVEPVTSPGESDAAWIRSHYGALELAGMRVELVGDAEFFDGDEWVSSPPVAGNREFVDVDGVSVPVMSLDYERAQYRAKGDDERLARLEGSA
jgi:hypothetical protein